MVVEFWAKEELWKLNCTGVLHRLVDLVYTAWAPVASEGVGMTLVRGFSNPTFVQLPRSWTHVLYLRHQAP